MKWPVVQKVASAVFRTSSSRSVSTEYIAAVTSASRLLGHNGPSNDLSLESLLRDNDVHGQLNAGHPLIAAIRQVDRQRYGLVCLLFSKLVQEQRNRPRSGHNSGYTRDGDQRDQLVIDKKKLLLAEAVEAIEAGCLLHSKVASRTLPSDLVGSFLPSDKDTVVSGSHLIHHRASRKLLMIGDASVMANVQKAIQNFVEGEFLFEALVKLIATKSDQVNFVQKAEKIKFLKHGSLLGQACKSMVHLDGDLNDNVQLVALNFGLNFAAALSTFSELSTFDSDLAPETLEVSTPLLFALEEDPSMAQVICDQEHCGLAASKVHEQVRRSGALDKTHSLLHMYTSHALDHLRPFEDSQSKAALIDVLLSLKRR